MISAGLSHKPLHIEVIATGFEVYRFVSSRLLRRIELQPQTRSHLLRHRILNREDVGHTHIEVISPQRCAVRVRSKLTLTRKRRRHVGRFLRALRRHLTVARR